MRSAPPHTPERFIADFFTAFTDAVMHDDGSDPGATVDRFHTPDIVQISNGIRLDRERLAAHLRSVRKNLREYRFEVHEAFADGDRIAARLTIHARMRKEETIITEVYLFGEFTPDGRMRRSHQLSRTVTAE
ncbi:nuclear transport factor 2 family protein [Nocardia mexicana]|uniref:SnoaL-like protein n=1 Tax=Nocardia mexicana TaxID=279262 RepID=A0A370H5V3_9NOCA|nr:nuclear transport factor 2 family protein [Nocardia mexicana]RDI51797.1 SnoaL-like protein [Nocardia mexicana]